jgi:hypothetical protein
MACLDQQLCPANRGFIKSQYLRFCVSHKLALKACIQTGKRTVSPP